jgi:hypothetical protein
MAAIVGTSNKKGGLRRPFFAQLIVISVLSEIEDLLPRVPAGAGTAEVSLLRLN